MANTDITKIPAPRTPFLDENSGDITPAWYRFLYNLFIFTGSGGDGGLAVNRGGTGQTSYTDGQLLIGNSIGNTLNKNTLTPGTGIGVTNGHGTIAVANTGVTSVAAGSGVSVSAATGAVIIANTGVLSVIAGAGVSVSSATGNVTVANTGVLSVSGGTTGLTPTTPTTGNVVLAGTLVVANGGTGATNAATARTNLGAAASGANSDITSLSGLTTPLSIAQGGTNAATAATARTNLGLGSGLSVTITTAKLTVLGANGSMTFVNGILTAQTQAT